MHRITPNLTFKPIGEGRTAQIRRYKGTWMISGFMLNTDLSEPDELVWDGDKYQETRTWSRVKDDDEDPAVAEDTVSEDEKEDENDVWKTIEFNEAWYRDAMEDPSFRYLGLACDDTPNADMTWAYPEIVRFLQQCEDEGRKVLVHCGHGRNRSAAAIVLYLVRRKLFSLPHAVNRVSKRRAKVFRLQSFLQALIEEVNKEENIRPAG